MEYGWILVTNGIRDWSTFRTTIPLVHPEAYERTFRIECQCKADCGTTMEDEGIEEYPKLINIDLGPTTGTVTFTYNTGADPEKFILNYAGVDIYNSTYVGNPSEQPALNAWMISRGYPTETITSGFGGSYSFYKSAASPELLSVYVYSPLSPYSWDFTVSCPDGISTTSTTSTTLATTTSSSTSSSSSSTSSSTTSTTVPTTTSSSSSSTSSSSSSTSSSTTSTTVPTTTSSTSTTIITTSSSTSSSSTSTSSTSTSTTTVPTTTSTTSSSSSTSSTSTTTTTLPPKSLGIVIRNNSTDPSPQLISIYYGNTSSGISYTSSTPVNLPIGVDVLVYSHLLLSGTQPLIDVDFRLTSTFVSNSKLQSINGSTLTPTPNSDTGNFFYDGTGVSGHDHGIFLNFNLGDITANITYLYLELTGE